jgi:beta-1,4-N-acetylglucosaminyltransferase
MILVTTGTNAPAFDRLLREIDELNLDEPLFVQHGPSAIRPKGATYADYVSYDQFVELVRDARVVVTHAGVGSILTSLINGKHPVVVPRLARLGEHVDDHQLELARRLNDAGVITLVTNPTELEHALQHTPPTNPPATTTKHSHLATDLANYLKQIINTGA